MPSYRKLRAENNRKLPKLTMALAAAQRGHHIFPIAEFSKTPHPDVRSWADVATNDVAEIRRRGWPKDANVGIACGPSGLLVVDTDNHGGADGIKAYRLLCEENEPDGDYPDTRIIETPTSGLHHYYRNPDPSRYSNGTGSLPDGIDVRGGGSGSGGYVLAAGSVVDRRAYQGKPDLQELVGDGKAYEVYNDAPVMVPPDWLIAHLDAGPASRGGGANGRGVKRPLWAVKVENPQKLKNRLDGAIQKLATEANGNRNELLFWTACTVGEAVAAERAEYADAEADLMAACEDNGLLGDDGEYRVRATIHSGFKTAGAL